jgi:hypothetical protein
MRLPAFCTAILAYVVIGHPSPAVAQVDQQRAAEFFKEAQALCVCSTGWPPRRGGESFVRTFAYASGPAYGLLLDAASPGWPRTVRASDDPAALLMRALGVQPVADAAAAAGVPLCCRVLQNVPACASAG